MLKMRLGKQEPGAYSAGGLVGLLSGLGAGGGAIGKAPSLLKTTGIAGAQGRSFRSWRR